MKYRFLDKVTLRSLAVVATIFGWSYLCYSIGIERGSNSAELTQTVSAQCSPTSNDDPLGIREPKPKTKSLQELKEKYGLE